MTANYSEKFPPAFYRRYAVGQLEPAETDAMLANGWFRNDLMVCAMSVKAWHVGWRSCLMLRIPLEGFTWKKKLRKMLRRNGALFSVQIQPFTPSEEKEQLWQKFKTQVHQWNFVPPLHRHLFRDAPPENFHSWEVEVYHEGKLVAFSIFDRGVASIASLEAAYDPAFRQHSLGLYTMLLEIQYGIGQGMKFYYPGFIPKDVPMFGYKLRPGSAQFYRLRERRWVSWEDLKPGDWLFELVMERLGEVSRLLASTQLLPLKAFGVFINQPGEPLSPAHFNIQLIVVDKQHLKNSDYRFVCWDPVEQYYLVFKANLIHPLGISKEAEKHWVPLFDIEPFELVGKAVDAAGAVALIAPRKQEVNPQKWFFRK